MLIWRYSRTNVIFMRVSFLRGKQKKFINKLLLKISVKEAAKICNLSERTIRDWRREKFLPDFNTLNKLCKKTSIKFPSKVKLKSDYWYVAKGASKGGKAVWRKYGRIGSPEYRKKKWYEWWEKKGKFIDRRGLFKRRLIKKPTKSSDLAEFIGIMLGDGSISITSKQFQVDLNKANEKEYQKFVNQLIKKLFGINPSIYYRRTSNGTRSVVCSSELCDYLTKLGLNRGKGEKRIPQWILKNQKYQLACLRGLMDTDGCVFTHHYKVNGKFYSYKKLAFKSYFYSLIKSVHDFLKSIGFRHPRIAKNLKEVRIENREDVQRYFQLIGFHNPKNLKRYKN